MLTEIFYLLNNGQEKVQQYFEHIKVRVSLYILQTECKNETPTDRLTKTLNQIYISVLLSAFISYEAVVIFVRFHIVLLRCFIYLCFFLSKHNLHLSEHNCKFLINCQLKSYDKLIVMVDKKSKENVLVYTM